MKSYRSIVVLTGAGISAESGIRTFRASDGLWEEHRVEDVATPEAFAANPALVLRFYNERRKQLLQPDLKPNPAHLALAKLEEKLPCKLTVVTQNIDNLHERAGSENLIHMHGELLKMFCAETGRRFVINDSMSLNDRCLCCGKTGTLRPDIVWFGEIPYRMDEITAALSECDLFVSIGTSGHVYPAAGFVELARHSGADTLEINLEPGQRQNAFHQHLYGRAGDIVPLWAERMLSATR
ncbi:MAG: NAD-dependent protein deacylase [Pseudomonadales bacterium]|nr:NAD-dependent protein deacylase [Pseudomonadales bacterium]